MADALDSGSSARKGVEVQLLSAALRAPSSDGALLLRIVVLGLQRRFTQIFRRPIRHHPKESSKLRTVEVAKRAYYILLRAFAQFCAGSKKSSGTGRPARVLAAG